MANLGSLKTWNEAKGYGFIQPTVGGADVFVHARDFPFHQRRPREGDRIQYVEGLDEKKRSRATKPRILGLTSSAGLVGFVALWLLSLALGALLLGEALSVSLEVTVIALYVFGSALTFTAYIWDKHRAVTGGGRVSESTLHGLELLGGWPGALAAQRIFRHKNRKASYQIVFWAIVVLHLGGWWFVFSK